MFRGCKAATPEEAADLALLRDNIESTLFQLDVMQGYRYRPQDYVEMIGSGLFFPLTSTDGTEQSRLRLCLRAWRRFRGFLRRPATMSKQADPVFIDTALDENAGNTGVIDQIGSMIPAGSPLARATMRHRRLRARRSTAMPPGLRTTWPTSHIQSPGATGPAAYAKIFAFALGPGTHETPDSVLAAAEQDLPRVRSEMYAVALPLHQQWFPDHKRSHRPERRCARRTRSLPK